MLGPGARVAGYEVVRLAGLGAMCHVYEARGAADGQRVALKVLHGSWCSDEEVLARFDNEASILRTTRHRHVVGLLGSGKLSGGAPYLVLEWLPRNLAQVLAEKGGPLEIRTASRFALHIASALGALHARGIVHRDLKAANVLVDRDDLAEAEVRLADLGLAKVSAHGERALVTPGGVSTGGSAMLGTWDYMAPEQWIKSKAVEPASDVYSLGVLLFQMLTGGLPFLAERSSDLMSLHLFAAPPLGRLPEETPAPLMDLVGQMLGKVPSTRPRTEVVSAQLLEIAQEQEDTTIDTGA